MDRMAGARNDQQNSLAEVSRDAAHAWLDAVIEEQAGNAAIIARYMPEAAAYTEADEVADAARAAERTAAELAGVTPCR